MNKCFRVSGLIATAFFSCLLTAGAALSQFSDGKVATHQKISVTHGDFTANLNAINLVASLAKLPSTASYTVAATDAHNITDESVEVSVSARGTFLHTNSDSPTSPTIINLADAGFLPGDALTFTYVIPDPGFGWRGGSGGSGCTDFRNAANTTVLGVFSSSSTLLSTSVLARVPDAIDAGPDIVTGGTLVGNQPTDIPEDFRISPPSGFTIVVPAGATHLLLVINDSLYRDNCGTIIVSIIKCTPTATVSGDASICSGGSATISATLTGTGPWNITWSDAFTQNGVTSSPATRIVNPAITTVYTVTSVSDANCTGTSSGSATVTVNPLPTATVSGDVSICASGSATISAGLTGNGPWSITWSDGYMQSVTSSPSIRVVSPVSTTIYTVIHVSDVSCTGTSSGSAMVNVREITHVTADAQSPCDPATNTYTQQVIVTYFNPPALGSLVVNGQSFAITTSPQTVTLTGLASDGSPVDVAASFSDNPGCPHIETALFTAPPSCRGPSLMYITDRDLFTIFSANLDGSGSVNLFPPSGGRQGGGQTPDGIAIDAIHDKVYWTNGSEIRCANLDGSNLETALTPPEGQITGGPALDVLRGKIYWAIFCCSFFPGENKIQHANLDGTGSIETLLTLPAESGLIDGIALDLDGGKIYWTLNASFHNPADSKIQRANLLNGSNIQDLVTTVLNGPMGIALNVAGGRMYWADRRHGDSDVIQYAFLDGTGIETLVSGIEGVGGVALDVAAGKLYWAERFAGNLSNGKSVFRANLDGTGVEDLAPAGVDEPEFIALYLPPINTPAGTNINVSPQDATSGGTPVTLTYANVGTAGNTSLTTSNTGPATPSGFAVGTPAIYYDLATTAIFTGTIQICINYTGTTFTDESAIQLQHYEGGAWVDVTTSRDPDNDIICGNVTSLSPFAIFEPTIKPFVFLANKVTLKSTKQVPSYGDIHSNGLLTVEKGYPSTYNSNLTAIGKITINKQNTINGNVKSQTSISNSGTITGTKTIGAVANQSLPSLSYSAGGANQAVPSGGSLTLAPGSYGIVTMSQGGTLKLTSGEYFMNELRYSSTIEAGTIEIDLSSGDPITINVVSNLQLGHEAAVVLLPNGETDSDLVTINTLQTTAANWGREGYFLGSFNAPNAIVTLVKNTQLRGSICAKEILVSNDCLLLHHSSPGSLPGPGNLPKSSGDNDEQPATNPAESGQLVTSYQLEQNYPNPFNPSTMISYQLPEASEVSLAIYNSAGQLVRTLVAGEKPAGRYSVMWDGKDDRGARVASGVYVYRLNAGEFVAQRKLVLMK